MEVRHQIYFIHTEGLEIFVKKESVEFHPAKYFGFSEDKDHYFCLIISPIYSVSTTQEE